jgi:hypothetical protein
MSEVIVTVTKIGQAANAITLKATLITGADPELARSRTLRSNAFRNRVLFLPRNQKLQL